MHLPDIRPHRAFAAIALLPLLEPVCASLALGEGSPALGRLASAWLIAAPAIQILAIALALFSLAMIGKGLLAERGSAPSLRFWSLILAGAFFSVFSVYAWYPTEARHAAERRAETATHEAKTAIRRYRQKHGKLPPTLDALVPTYLAAIPSPRIAGSELTYHPDPEKPNAYTLSVPGPGTTRPLATFHGNGTLIGDTLPASLSIFKRDR